MCLQIWIVGCLLDPECKYRATARCTVFQLRNKFPHLRCGVPVRFPTPYLIGNILQFASVGLCHCLAVIVSTFKQAVIGKIWCHLQIAERASVVAHAVPLICPKVMASIALVVIHILIHDT
jgi:hypothetical protein